MIHRYISALLIFCFTHVLAFAALSEETIAALLEAKSPHPTTLTVEHQGKRFPVLRMKKRKPIIKVNGQEKKLATGRNYMPMRASSYGPENVTLIDAGYSALQIVDDASIHGVEKARMGAHPGVGEFKGVLQSRRTMKDPFISIIVYTPLMFLSGEHQAYFVIHVFTRELPDLPAGKKVKVRFTTKMPIVFPGQRHVVQIFDRQGREAKTNIMQDGWPYFALTERNMLGEAIPRYLSKFSGQDHSVSPIVMMNPVLPENTIPPKEPIIAKFTVTPEGTVKEIDLDNSEADELNTAVREAVQGWLFLPRLVGGKPVEALVEVPIQF